MNQPRTVPRSRPETLSHAKLPRPIVRLPLDREWFDAMPGERIAILVHSDDVKGRYCVFESIGGPGAGTPMHYHAEDEIFHVVNGILTFAIDGAVFDAHSGATVVVPAGVRHAWRNRQRFSSHVLVTFTPGGIEGLLRQLADADPETIARLAAEYGSQIVGPGIDE